MTERLHINGFEIVVDDQAKVGVNFNRGRDGHDHIIVHPEVTMGETLKLIHFAQMHGVAPALGLVVLPLLGG